MNNKSFSSFKDAFLKSVSRSNSQLIVLSQSGLFLFLYFARDAILAAAIFALGYWQKRTLGTALEGISILYLLFMFVKYNGALGLVLTQISMGQAKASQIVPHAVKNGTKYFTNSLGAGVILLFGQTLLACPCFLFLNNFIFSPYLYVYENLKWKQARKRSSELSRGLTWFVLARTLAIVAIGYLFIFIAFALFLMHSVWLAAVLALLIVVYFGLVQSNFIWDFYNQVQNASEEQRRMPPSIKYKVLTSFSVILVVLIYVFIKQLKI